MVIIVIFQAPYIFADYTWFYIGIGATAGGANIMIHHTNDDCNDADKKTMSLIKKNNVNDKTIPGAALLLILANVCLGCKYK